MGDIPTHPPVHCLVPKVENDPVSGGVDAMLRMDQPSSQDGETGPDAFDGGVRSSSITDTSPIPLQHLEDRMQVLFDLAEMSTDNVIVAVDHYVLFPRSP
ncbi:hypothetical protein PMZ80_011154 [Knufia obscura]|uniref:Uncharacterized protein n=1 Tax=Knufia obscura TaxID=1635080 RepID=A0ABR0R8S1_9EURO|nr:hypothetical protein LTR70_007399 [Exophiala xenobiotica]KAK5936589.1 hypothetical protein PMZ80_011154 [Knufia obscura]